MRVLNIHEATFPVTAERLGALIDTLSSAGEALWPRETWPAMRFDRPLAAGARGGHGPIRYDVESYEPGRSIRFRFTGPRGFDGTHGYEVVDTPGGSLLRQRLEMKTSGIALISWPLLFRPLHDALIEDSFTKAELELGIEIRERPWPLRVRCLRWLATGGRSRKQGVLLAKREKECE